MLQGNLRSSKATTTDDPCVHCAPQEILSDDRVQSAIKSGRGGRVRSEQETGAASSVTVTGDGRQGASPAPEVCACNMPPLDSTFCLPSMTETRNCLLVQHGTV